MTAPSLRLARPSSYADRRYAEGTRLALAGKLEEAETAFRDVVRLKPDHVHACNNLGTVLDRLGRTEEALEAYRAGLASGVQDAVVCYNIGSVLRRNADPAAIPALKAAIALQPDYALALNNLANGLTDLNAGETGSVDGLASAAALYFRALALSPDQPLAHDNLGRALYLMHVKGAGERAAALARTWRNDHPGNPLARHIGAAILGQDEDARASDDYVRRIFDPFAASFEAILEGLGYRAPEALAAALGAAGAGEGLDVLDAGCGTGLCAPLLRSRARHLVGVDLSSGMLEKARDRGLYDELVEAELGAFLSGRPGAFDLIVAADVLCYFGDLAGVLAAAGRALRPGGLLAFTLERLDGEGEHRVNPHGRYAHAEAYVRRALTGAGLALGALGIEALRCENGRPVIGFVVTARRDHGIGS